MGKGLQLTQYRQHLLLLKQTSIENNVGKGGIAQNESFPYKTRNVFNPVSMQYFYLSRYFRSVIRCLRHLLTFSHIQTLSKASNIVAKEGIVHNEQCFLLPQCFQLYLILKLSFMELFHVYANKLSMFSKPSAADVIKDHTRK